MSYVTCNMYYVILEGWGLQRVVKIAVEVEVVGKKDRAIEMYQLFLYGGISAVLLSFLWSASLSKATFTLHILCLQHFPCFISPFADEKLLVNFVNVYPFSNIYVQNMLVCLYFMHLCDSNFFVIIAIFYIFHSRDICLISRGNDIVYRNLKIKRNKK